MKHSIVFMGVLGLFAGLMYSCFHPLVGEDDDLEPESSSSAKTSLRLMTRSTTGVIDYPVMILSYDVNGNKCGQQILLSDEDQVKMTLPVGSYHISALTGYAAYSQPADYQTSAVSISIPEQGYATLPLFVGSADVDLTDKSASVDILMSSRCASITIALSGLPASVEATKVSLSKQYAALCMDGSFSSSSIAKIDCNKTEEGVWTTGTIYVLPGSEAQTVLTITFTDEEQQYSYGYTINEPLEAGRPYTLSGAYKGGQHIDNFDLGGSLSVEGWKDPHAFEFEFGEGATVDNSSEEGKKDPEVATAIPEPLTLWNGHAVALVLNKQATGADILLISKQGYDNVYSYYAEGHEMDAINLASGYNEDGETGWRIPTSYEMQQLKSAYADDKIAPLNALLLQAGGSEINQKDASGGDIRYLCDNAMQSACLLSGTYMTKTGKEQIYSLRMVKKIHVTVN